MKFSQHWAVQWLWIQEGPGWKTILMWFWCEAVSQILKEAEEGTEGPQEAKQYALYNFQED